MTSKQSKTTIDDFVVNPITNRLIKKGSKKYKQLITAKLLNEVKPSTAEENLIIEADTPDQAKTLQSKLNKNIQPNKVITRRGTKVLKASRRPTREETINKISDLAISSVVESKDYLLEQDMTDEDMDKYIRGLIQQKLIGHNTKATLPPPPPPPTPEIKRISTKDYNEYDDIDDCDY